MKAKIAKPIKPMIIQSRSVIFPFVISFPPFLFVLMCGYGVLRFMKKKIFSYMVKTRKKFLTKAFQCTLPSEYIVTHVTAENGFRPVVSHSFPMVVGKVFRKIGKNWNILARVSMEKKVGLGV